MNNAASPNKQRETFLELRDVSLEISGERLLKNVHLAVGREEIVAIMGPSGQGKSLLLKVIAGLIEPTSGEILIDGRSRSEFSPQERLKLARKTGMLFQKNALFDSLTCLENVSFPQIETLGKPRDASDQRSRELLDAVGLAIAAERYPSEISGGMQKRLGIARALSLEPSFLLYDDPTAGLDPITSRKIIRLINDLQEQHKSTALVVTNEVARAYQVADRVAFVFKGELIMAGTPEETKVHRDPRVHAFVRGQVLAS